ncbi:MAG TPA: TonB-dependent receptor plug domain-containing protein, partial [Acidobacteriaceae bacterium]|nr:TonB-dependent receptor plug domain-containing protein [Acidobacteriaceae bacterium]
TTSNLDTTLSGQAVNQLPVARQDWTSILQLGPGLSTVTTSNSPAGASLTINGLPPAGFNLTVDGTNATSDPETPAFGFYQGPNIINTINNDAIAEVNVVKGIAPATVGGTMSGNVNIVTKSGGSKFHGSLYEINDVSAYDARNQFLTKKPRSTFNEYGGSIGGPILPKSLFFFGSYEGARLSAAQPVTDTVPTPYLQSISPATYAPVFAVYPKVAQPADPTALTTQYFAAGSVRQTDGNGTVRLDYNITPNDLLYARYIRSRPFKLAPNDIVINQRNTTGHTDGANAGYTHAAQSWTSMTRFGYNRIRLQRLDGGFSSDLEELIFNGIDSQGAEQFAKSGDFYSGEQEFALTRGKHTIQLGGIVQRQDAGRTDYNTAQLQYSSLAGFLNNSPSHVQITFDLSPFNLHIYQLGGFVQDDYKVTDSLTLNLGVRYDYFTVPKEDNNRVFNRGVDPANPQWGPGFGPYRPAGSMYNADYTNFQPRLGFVWTPPHSSTVFHGGFGILTSPHPIFGGPIDMVQESASQPFRVILNSQQAQSADIKYPLPRTQYQDVLAGLQSSGVISKQLANATINPNFPNPYSLQWTFGMEQQLPSRVVFSLDYVGNHGLHENMTETHNLPDRVTGIPLDPTFSEFRYYYGGDSSNYHGLQVQLQRQFSRGFSFSTVYVWSKALSYGQANLLLQNAPQDNNNIRAEYGLAPFDVRNNFVTNGLWEIPLLQWTHTSGRAAGLLLGGWQLSGIFTGSTGMPANILDTNSSYPSDRPDPSGGSFYLGNYNSTHRYLNAAAFNRVPISAASGAQIRGGYLRRDAITQPGSELLDAGLSKTFDFTEKVHFQLKADTFNTLNHTNLTGLVTSISSSSFGQLTSATARTMQLTGRLTF